MIRALYQLTTAVATPFFAGVVTATPRYRTLIGRLTPPTGMEFSQPPIWVHACSVGEINSAKPLLQGLADRYPEIPLVLTTSTVSGMEMAESLSDLAQPTWFPFDEVHIVRRFLTTLKPRCLIILETEIWPNAILETARRNIPVAIASARLSDKHFGHYRRMRSLTRQALGAVQAIGAQSELYAQRFVELGADSENIAVVGNIKFDIAPSPPETGEQTRLRDEMGISPDAPVVVFGSTRPGDEALAAQCLTDLRVTLPDVQLIVAPRHLSRLGEATRAFKPGECVLRSEMSSGSTGAKSVIIVDALGDLVHLYGIADVAVIGGSFFAGVEGHNPIEPAAQGIPSVFGPYMRNFRDAAEMLVAARGAVQIDAPNDLASALRELLRHPEDRHEIGKAAVDVVDRNRGTLTRHLDLFAPFLENPTSTN